jgi:hypothetical protein
MGDPLDQAELAKELGDLLPQKQLEIDRLRGLLARLEWAADYECPACRGREIHGGHEPDCWLAAELPAEPP